MTHDLQLTARISRYPHLCPCLLSAVQSKYLAISWHPPPVQNTSTYLREGAAPKRQRSSCRPYPPPPQPQEPAAPKVKQRALPPSSLPPPPPPPDLSILQSAKACHGSASCDPFPPPPLSPILTVLEEREVGLLPWGGGRRRAKLGKVEKQGRKGELDMNTSWKTLMNQIQKGVKLKPVSSQRMNDSSC